MHGTIDNLVPVEQARRFVAALRDAGADVTYVELAGAPHAFDVFHSAWEHVSTTGIEWWLSSVVPGHRRGPDRNLTIRDRRARSERSDDHGAYGAIVSPASASSTAS